MSSVTEKTNNGAKGWLSKKQVDAYVFTEKSWK